MWKTQPLDAHYHGRLSLDLVLSSLVSDGWINNQDANAVRAAASNNRSVDLHPLILIANEKINNAQVDNVQLDLEALSKWLATKSNLDYFRIDAMKIDMDKITGVISEAYAKRHKILPIKVTQNEAIFATAEPFLDSWVADLSKILRRKVTRVVCNPLDIHRYMLEFFTVNRSMKEAETQHENQKDAGILNFEQLLKLGQMGNLSADDQHVVHIVDWLLQFAFEQRASDIHLEPRREQGNVRFRIDGVLHQVYQIPPKVMAAVTSRIKILGRMDVAEKRRPQDGRIKTLTPTGREIELRLSTMPTAFGEKCVLRIFDPDIISTDFKDLGFAQRDVKIWNEMVYRPHGIVLVTGPTGSGKTTTLYSTLKQLAKPELNVCTIEDPIEMVTPELNQMQIQRAIDLSFADGIRTLLRQDPDIIMIGEIRDLETAEMAIQASLTGHLVLSTLHTNDAPSAISRLLDLGVPYYLIQGTLAGIMAQRLIRRLCPHCKKPGKPDPAAWKSLTHPWKVKMPEKIFRPKGCLECRETGFRGRIGVYEMLPITPVFKEAVNPETNVNELRKIARDEGMRPLRLSAAAQIAAGQTTIKEAIEVLPPVEI
ncbi:MAG: GspE/PulE family protein [bacterium]